MALERVTVVDRIEILEDETIQVRLATYILEDGKRVIDAKYHRTSYDPSEDTNHLPEKAKAIADILWTKEVVDAHKAKLAALLPKGSINGIQ